MIWFGSEPCVFHGMQMIFLILTDKIWIIPQFLYTCLCPGVKHLYTLYSIERKKKNTLLHLLLFQAFGFINLILWVGNLWFVFKETGIIAPFMRAPPPQEKPAAADTYGQQGAYEQDPYASNQGGYQPDYNQQGYNQVISWTAELISYSWHILPLSTWAHFFSLISRIIVLSNRPKPIEDN